MYPSSSPTSVFLLMTVACGSLCFAEDSAADDVCASSANCISTRQLFCCSPSPASLPDWRQLFAKTLSLRPQLLDQLHVTTTQENNDDDNNNDICSLRVIEERRSQLLHNTNRQCQNYTCPGQTSPTAEPVSEKREILLIIVVVTIVGALALAAFIVAVHCFCLGKCRHQAPGSGDTSLSTSPQQNGNTRAYNRNVSKTSLRRELMGDDSSFCDTPPPTPSAGGYVNFTLEEADHVQDPYDVVIEPCDPQPADNAAETSTSRV